MNGDCIPESWECDDMDDCGDNSDEENCNLAGCYSDQFTCGNGMCIPKSWECDDDDDCGDNSDENCGFDCDSNQFTCGNGKCIPKSWECNDEDDCGDNSDENCGPADCDSDQFTCTNGKCIQESWECDDMDDCGDNSDERNCTGCDSDHFTCMNGDCIPESWECDDMDDCGDNSDENCELSCGYDKFTCGNQNCINASFICDGDDDCGDNSDEALCDGGGGSSTYNGCEYGYFPCANQNCISTNFTCDGDNDCGDNSDEVFCVGWGGNSNKTNCDFGRFTCTTGKCIRDSWKCDGMNDCGDNSDEKNCSCDSEQFTCMNSQCIPDYYQCDGEDDCGDNSDEKNCSCDANHFICMNGECILESWKCDNVDDCGDNSDEKNCSCDSDHFTCVNGQCISDSWQCDGEDDCGDNSDENNCMSSSSCSVEDFECPNGPRLCIPGNWECNGYPDCSDGFDEEDCKNGIGWSEWTKWGQCNVACGAGEHSRTRHCLNSEGEGCDGDDVEFTTCHLKPCYEEAETGCGTRVNQALPRITGGQDALPGEWPWQAQFYNIHLEKSVCGGTLIGPKHIISAGHCFDSSEGKTTENWKVRLGKYRYSSIPGNDEQPLELNITQIIRHENFSFSGLVNDIAIVELEEEVTPTNFINYACLNIEGEAVFDKHSYCFTTGWGLTQIFDYITTGDYIAKSEKYNPKVLQEVQVKVIPNDICNSSSSYGGSVTSNMICAGYLDRGTCKGDSGGPLVCLHQNSDDGLGHWYLFGVVSWGRKMCSVTKHPGIFTRVDNYLEWIRDKGGIP
ncbi:uncharacterized protein LOC144452224 [Glandiceps talaboti]